MKQQIKLYDFEPDAGDFYQEVVAGLQKPAKELPYLLLYDERGSELFDKLCETEEYYLTRTEMSIMQKYIDEMVALIGENTLFIEYGSGSSLKTRLLLDHLPHLAGYVPIDISKEYLMQAAMKIAEEYPHLELLPVCADYEQPFSLPSPTKPVMRRVAYYPGSTIGQSHPHKAIKFLEQVREMCSPNGGLLIGVDLKKETEILNRAYNDSEGAIHASGLNVLSHVNRRFKANFDLNRFEWQGYYNESLGRVEFRLVSRQEQTVDLNGEPVFFKAGKKILFACSYKYSLDEFAELAAKGGWNVEQVWTDDNQLFSVQFLTSR